MRFWDSSALVALHVRHAETTSLRGFLADDADVIAWAMSDVEVRSALCRLAREGALGQDAFQEAVRRTESFWSRAHVVSLVDAVKVRAKRLLGSHALRAADALQLGAALTAVHDDPVGAEFVCLDDRLVTAARREGFTVLP